MKKFWQILKKTAAAWNNSDPFREGAAAAYYAIFSIPALLVIVVSSAGLIFGEKAVTGEISSQIGDIMGEDTAQGVEEIIERASTRKTSIAAAVISVVTLIVGSTGVFKQLQISLNRIWGVKVLKKRKLIKKLRDRLLSFVIVLSIGFLLLVSLLVSAALSAFSDIMRGYMSDFIVSFFSAAEIVVSIGIISVLFALMFKILPDAVVSWKDVWAGAFVTAILFTLGKFLLGFYFGKTEPGSVYGAAGSIVLIMLWVSYSCMIIFFGAEFTKQHALQRGQKVIPKRYAELLKLDPAEDKIAEMNRAVRKTEQERIVSD